MADQYALGAARVSVAQLADDVGFDSMHTSSYAILSELLMRYMEELGLASHGYAELASRTEPNALDVMLALNDLGVSITELKEFKATQKGVAFPASIVPFPVAKKPKPAPTFESLGEEPPAHIPSFLPAFPDKHTYCGTSSLPLPSQDATARHLAGVEAAAEAERALVKLHARMAPPGSVLAGALPREETEPRSEAGPVHTDAGLGTTAGTDGELELAASGADPWMTPPTAREEGLVPPPFPPVDEDMTEPLPDPTSSRPIDSAAGNAAAAGAAGSFQPWDWQARLGGLVALPRAAGGDGGEDAFAAATGAGAAVSTKHGRQAKRSARALDAGYAPADPTRTRVEDIIAIAGSAEEAAVAGGAGPGSELLYGADDDDAEQL